MGNRLPTPEVRLQPGVAAADGANNSFFGGDDVGDLDTMPNFYGTSAAAPHAAAVAALVLEAPWRSWQRDASTDDGRAA